jgi:hypothetical protein
VVLAIDSGRSDWDKPGEKKRARGGRRLPYRRCRSYLRIYMCVRVNTKSYCSVYWVLGTVPVSHDYMVRTNANASPSSVPRSPFSRVFLNVGFMVR